LDESEREELNRLRAESIAVPWCIAPSTIVATSDGVQLITWERVTIDRPSTCQ
jgi:hypothetical protein